MKTAERFQRTPDKIKMVKTAFKQLDPTNFAIALATGALSLAFHMQGWGALSKLFLFFGVAALVFFTFLFSVGFFFSKESMKEGFSIEGIFKYFSLAAASGLLGSVFFLVGAPFLGMFFGGIGFLSTIALTLILFGQIFLQETSSIQKLSPVWLFVPAAILASGYALNFFGYDWSAVTAKVFWWTGVFFYIGLMAVNLYRIFALPVRNNELSPNFWLWTGVAALAVLGVQENFPLWALATAWLPILATMLFCKHYLLNQKVQYEPAFWVVPFALAAYAAITPASFWLWLAVAVWLYVLYLAALPFLANLRK